MRKTLSSIGATALLIGLVAWNGGYAVGPAASSCGQPADETMRSLVAGARHLVSAPSQAKMRGILNVDAMDPALVKPIQWDSLCNLAGRTISRDRNQPDTTSRTVYLVSMGRVYWAEDTTIQAGEFVGTYILDSSLTKVLSRPLR